MLPGFPANAESWAGVEQDGVQNWARLGRAASPCRPASRDVPPQLGARGLVCFGTDPMWRQLTQKQKKREEKGKEEKRREKKRREEKGKEKKRKENKRKEKKRKEKKRKEKKRKEKKRKEKKRKKAASFPDQNEKGKEKKKKKKKNHLDLQNLLTISIESKYFPVW
ncbi:hypothetical protein llap_3792 [Limosa lapponica baueri]|uniref:Uncharacterized protein n=1 Tax=Limosa lapponica baueri TaxID=1758121 RepID=A0A2I0UIP0_LIMLA|nr:hypothetical protein llap_3792 [Limosa lapponica baueri]